MKIKICKTCKKDYERKNADRSIYCTRECYYKMKKIRGDRVNWTMEMRLKFSNYQKGANNPAWKGGVTKERTKELNTIKYKQFKKAVFRLGLNKCKKCGSKESLQVDHIKPWKFNPELRFVLSNAQLLCAQCHYKKSSEEGKKYWINQVGMSSFYSK